MCSPSPPRRGTPRRPAPSRPSRCSPPSRAASREDAIVATDVGQHQMWCDPVLALRLSRPAADLRRLRHDGLRSRRRHRAPNVGNPDKVVIHITGDGCFRMNGNELATVEHYKLPVITFIFNNGNLGMVRQWQNLTCDKRFSQTALNRGPDFVKSGARPIGLGGTPRQQPAGARGRHHRGAARERTGPWLCDRVLDRRRRDGSPHGQRRPPHHRIPLELTERSYHHERIPPACTPSPSWWTMRPASSLRSPACSPARAINIESLAVGTDGRPGRLPHHHRGAAPTKTRPSSSRASCRKLVPVHSVQHPLRRAFHPARAGAVQGAGRQPQRAQRGHPARQTSSAPSILDVSTAVLDARPSSATRQRVEALMDAAA